jgi:uncharacterized membrane protein YfcA
VFDQALFRLSRQSFDREVAMPADTPWLPALAVMLIAGVIKGCIGFGAPLFAVPALAPLVGIKAAIILVTIPAFANNAAIIATRRVERSIVVQFVPTMLALIAATILGGIFLAGMHTATLSIVVGAVALGFVILSASAPKLATPPGLHRVMSPVLGGFAGILNGATSIPGPLFAMYLSTLPLDRRAFVYGITLLLVTANVTQILTYAQLGLYGDGLLVGSLVLVPAQLLGQVIGAHIQDRLNPTAFGRLVLIAVAISGANLLVRGLGML